MDQKKIGSFIAECRKKNNLTQMQLAEKLNITDRAISKWENGKSMPDSAIMLDLCNALGISVNDLLSGEVVEMNTYNEKLEQNLVEVVKQKELADKRLLSLEIVIGVFSTVILLASVLTVEFVQMPVWAAVLVVTAGAVLFVIGMAWALKVEQVAGYYKCGKCGHKYIPKYNSVLWSMHINRTRYMKCPKCEKRSWNKKVLSEK